MEVLGAAKTSIIPTETIFLKKNNKGRGYFTTALKQHEAKKEQKFAEKLGRAILLNEVTKKEEGP